MQVEPIGRVESARREVRETDFWGGVEARIVLAAELGDRALTGLDGYSHVEVIFAFDRSVPREHYRDPSRPRGRADLPEVGVFAVRSPSRPNLLGSTICTLVAVGDTWLTVRGLDAVDGTAVLDVKPVNAFQLPTGVREPAWARTLLRDYDRDAAATDPAAGLRPEARTARVDLLQEGYVRDDADGQHVGSTVGLVRDGDLVLVVDPGLVPSRGGLVADLRALGVAPEAVTDVVLSHHHPDHTVNIALFPKARVHDHWAVYTDDLWDDRDAHGVALSPSVRLARTPGHTAEDVSTIVGTAQGLLAFTHTWWTPEGPVEDPYAPDLMALDRSRALLAGLVDTIAPGHGPAFPVAAAPLAEPGA